MKADIQFVEIPEEAENTIGQPDLGTRFYKAYGPRELFSEWFDSINHYIANGEGFLTPGTLALYANVSRAAVYKRMKEGRLTAFQFQATEMYVDADGQTTGKLIDSQTFCFIPVSECRQWAKRSGKPILI